MISGSTQLLGVIGYPIAHSLSPIMQNAAIAALQEDYVYLPFAIAPADLPAAIAGFRALNLRGFNVTIPHKQTILPLLDAIDPEAQAIGAVNTVIWTDRGWYGTNTDVIGFLAPLPDRDWRKATVLVLGCGGAARAVVAGCAKLGCHAVRVVGRDAQKLQAFQQSWQLSWREQSWLGEPIAQFSVHSWQELSDLLPQSDLVVNTTPIGMAPHSAESPLSENQVAQLAKDVILYDLIYNPRPTRFLQSATQTIDGLEMLVQQGAAALQLWLDQTAPVEVMRSALLSHLDAKFDANSADR